MLQRGISQEYHATEKPRNTAACLKRKSTSYQKQRQRFIFPTCSQLDERKGRFQELPFKRNSCGPSYPRTRIILAFPLKKTVGEAEILPKTGCSSVSSVQSFCRLPEPHRYLTNTTERLVSPKELAGLVSKLNVDGAAGAQVLPHDGDFGAAGLWTSAGRQTRDGGSLRGKNRH